MLLVFSLTLVSLLGSAHARGAGRAFPLLAENYAIDSFQSINQEIEWDPTNFLVDKSGQFANCHSIKSGSEQIRDFTPEGLTIQAIYDYVEGSGVDVESVNGYIRIAIDRWMRSAEHIRTIREAERFGCSIRPGCTLRREDVSSIACLFSPGRDNNQQPDTPSGDHEPTTRRPTPRPTSRPVPTWTPRPTPRPTRPPKPPGPVEGLAFTPEQYDMAELITGNAWDKSHFLENLSGQAITCGMLFEVDPDESHYADAIETANGYGMRVMGLDGAHKNYGSTQVAMEYILKDFKLIRHASMVGCSVIPDCMDDRGDVGGEMWVVVSCIYEEPFQ